MIHFFVMFARYLVFEKAEGHFERGLYLVATTIMYAIFAIVDIGIFWRALLVEFLAIFAIFTAIAAVVAAGAIVFVAYLLVSNLFIWFMDFFFGVELYNFELKKFIRKLCGKEETTPHRNSYYDDYHYHY